MSSTTGRQLPEGSVMMMLIGAACRDHRQFPPDGDLFDIHRQVASASGVRRGARISASAPRWPGWRAASRWRRSSSASRGGMSTSKTPQPFADVHRSWLGGHAGRRPVTPGTVAHGRAARISRACATMPLRTCGCRRASAPTSKCRRRLRTPAARRWRCREPCPQVLRRQCGEPGVTKSQN